MLEHDKWLQIAKEDLKVAQIIIHEELYGSVTYHCQQSAEKSLKGFLVFKMQPVLKTHDLTKLLELCMQFDYNFKKLYESIHYINPFSSKFRYPSEYDIPSLENAKNAIKHSKKILNFVIKKILAPQTNQRNLFN